MACVERCANPSGQPSPRRARLTRSRFGRALKGGCHGYDAGKQIAGRKRHILVDTEGLLLAVQVQAASVQDPVGAGAVLAEAKACAPTLQLVWGDGRYQGPLVAQAAQAAGLRVEVVSSPRPKRLRGAAPALGGGAHLRLAGQVPTAGRARLRNQSTQQRGVD